jgi:hypothetical protein
LAAAIDAVVRLSVGERAARGQAGREFILSSRGAAAQGVAIRRFLESLC